MLYGADGQFHSGTTVWTCNTDEWSPDIVDLTSAIPTLQNTGELVWWIQIVTPTSSNDDTFQFKLACSATNDLTNLNGTVYYPLSTQAWALSGAFMQKTDGRGGFMQYTVPPDMDLRYWQVYCDYTSVTGSGTVTVYSGLALKSAVPVRVKNISCVSSVTVP